MKLQRVSLSRVLRVNCLFQYYAELTFSRRRESLVGLGSDKGRCLYVCFRTSMRIEKAEIQAGKVKAICVRMANLIQPSLLGTAK